MSADSSNNSVNISELWMIKVGIALLNIFVVIGSKVTGGGDLSEPIEIIAVAVSLLPTAIFAIGARTERAVKRDGLFIAGLTAFAWVPIGITAEAIWGITLFPVFVTSMVFAIEAVKDKPEQDSSDSKTSKSPWWNPTSLADPGLCRGAGEAVHLVFSFLPRCHGLSGSQKQGSAKIKLKLNEPCIRTALW